MPDSHFHPHHPHHDHQSPQEDRPGAGEQFVVVVEPHFALYRYLRVIHHKGYKTLVLALDPDSTLAAEKKNDLRVGGSGGSQIDELVRYETLSVDSMMKALEPYRGRIAGVVAGEDSAVPIAAELGRALGFDYALPEDARCQHLKTAMKQRLVERGVRTPAFQIARTLEEAIAAWERFGRDCMVKMVDFAASLNVFRVTERGQLEEAWDTIVNNRRQVKAFFELSRDVILEEFVAGREVTAEGYVQDDRVVVLNFSKKLTESNFIVVGHYIPALVTEEEEGQLAGMASQCVRALGLRNSVFHVEVHIRDGVPYVIECAARPPGQHAVELIEKSYGIDLMEISIDLATAKKVHVTRREPRGHHAILALYTKTSGVLEGYKGLDELRSRGGVLHVSLGAKPGDRVEALETFRHKYGLVILGSDSPHELREKAKWLRDNVEMVVGTP
ncbi:MAG TPA: ATP-grasp domain-containing protein [Thermoanaerobaculia bacterium]|nr:ATP-grasp domain-containing protein [Thermoanaerobaculia bacterium]